MALVYHPTPWFLTERIAYMLIVKKDFSIEQSEQALVAISAGERKLRIPHSIKSNAVGSVAALIQVISTWARSAEGEAVLKLYSSDPDDPSLSDFMKTPFGLAAANMANEIQLESGLKIERRAILEKAKEYVIAMHEGSLDALLANDKTSLSLISVDNAATYRRPRRLYNQSTFEPLSRRDFEDLTAACYRCIPMTSGRLNVDKHISSIASLIYEAFLNTHEHAQSDFAGNRFRRSMRGIIFSYEEVSIDSLIESAGSHAEMARYFTNWRPYGDGSIARFAEVSVFDMGPGLAESWLSKTESLDRRLKSTPPDPNAEYQAVLECLKKGGTTKDSRTRGNGMYRMLQVAQKTGGYLKIRSGHLSLIKAFSTQKDDNDFTMADSLTGEIPTTARPWAEGTVISAIIPLNRSL